MIPGGIILLIPRSRLCTGLCDVR